MPSEQRVRVDSPNNEWEWIDEPLDQQINDSLIEEREWLAWSSEERRRAFVRYDTRSFIPLFASESENLLSEFFPYIPLYSITALVGAFLDSDQSGEEGGSTRSLVVSRMSATQYAQVIQHIHRAGYGRHFQDLSSYSFHLIR